jgi:1-acyl-sn-glycerol-3-phosphate acyltransferase
MRALRSLLVFLWLVLSLVPSGLLLLLLSPLISSDRLWWGIAVPWLRGVIFMARVVGGVRYRISGWEHLPAAGDRRRVVLCSKHQSTWETFFFPSCMPHPLAFVFKQELLRIPFFGWALGKLDMIHIDRSRRTEAWSRVARQGASLMDRGKWVIMFPEGTRTERGRQGTYKTGATRLACETGAVVIPIALSSGRCWPRRTFRFIPGVIDVVIGPVMESAGRDPAALMGEVEAWIEGEMRRIDPEAYAQTAPQGLS